MTSANANVTVNTIVDKAFESAMTGMQRSMQQTITSINGFNRSQRAANASGGAISRTLNQISKEGRGLSSSFARVKADMAGLDAAFRKNRAVIAQLESSIKQLEAANRKHGLSTKTGFDTAPLKAYKSQLESVNAMQKEITNTQKAMNFMELGKKFNKSAQTLSYAGMRMTYGLSLPIGMFLRTGFQSLKALDKEVIRTGKLIGDGFTKGAEGTQKFNEAMAILDQRLDKLSITWGVSRELVQGLAGDFAEIGISDPKALANLAQFTAEFEKLGNVDITQAQASIQAIYQQIARVRRDQGIAVTGTKAINQMVEEVRGAIAFFNFAENKTTLSLKDMADAFPEVSAAATSFGLNMQTTAALLAPMVGAGFQVGASANSIKVSLQRLVAPTKKNQDIIKALTNVIGKDFRLSTKIGAEGIQDLIDGYTKLQDKLGDAGALTFFAELFGVRQGPRMEVAIKQMSEYQQELDKAGSAERTLAKELELQVNKQLQLAAMRNRSAEGRKVEFVQLNKIKDIQDLIQQSQEKSASGEFTERALAIQKAQEAEVKRLKDNNSEIDRGNNLLGERFDRIKTESGKILSGAMFGTALTSETLEEELTRVQGSIQVRYGRARESIKSIARELTVVFGDLLNAINPILEKISTWIQLLPSGTKKLIGVVLILLAALGPVLRTLGAASQIAGTFAMTRGKGILKFRNDVISLNGTLVESSNLLTRLGGKFTKIGKDGTFFGTRKDLKRLEAAAPIQEKIDAGERLSFAEKSIYKKSIKGLIGRREYLRVQAANASGQAGPLDQPVLPVGGANVSGFDIRSITTSQNLANPVKAIRDFTINLIKKMEQAVVNSANRASRKTRTPLNPRVGVNTAAAAAAAAAAGGQAVQTPSRRTAQSQSKPVSSQYYTKLMSILQAIQKCICSPGKVVTTSGGKPGGGQPASSNAPPAPKPTSKPAPQPTQPAGGGQSAPSPRNRPVTPSTPKPKQTGSFPALEAILVTQVAQTQQQVVNQVEQDIQQATNVAEQVKTSTKKAKDSAAKVSKKVTLTKDLILNIMKEAGVVIPQQFQEMKDFEVVVQKQIFEKIKAILSSTTGAADFLSGKIKSISGTTRAGSYDKIVKEALGTGRERTSPKAIKKQRDLMHLADIQSARIDKQYEADREHYISVGKKHLASVNRLESEINTIANQIDIAKKSGDQKEVERLESLGRYKTKILAEVQNAIEKNILNIQALSQNAIRDTYTDFLSGQMNRRAAGLESFASRSQARGFAKKQGLRYTDVAYFSEGGSKRILEDRKNFGFAPRRELTEEDRKRRQFGLSEAYQRRQEIRTGVRITAADIGMPKAPTAKEMTESVKKFTSRFEAGEGARIQAQASSAYDEVLKIKQEILNFTTKVDKAKEKLGKIAIEIQDLESKAPKGKLKSPKSIAKETARLERIEKLERDFSKTRKVVEDAEKQLTDANTRLQAIQGIASDYKPTASSVGTGGFKQPKTTQATTPLEETGLIAKGPEKITADAKKALKAQIVGFEKEIKLIEEKIAEYQTFKGSNVAKEKIADLERLRTQLQTQIKQAEAKLMASLPKISGGAFGFDTVIQQLKAALNLPEQKFQELVAELQNRAPKTTAGLNAPIAKIKGDVSKVVEAIKATVLSGDQSLDSLYNAVMSQRNVLAKWADQAASTSPVKPAAPAAGDLKASQDAMVQKVIDSAVSVKKVTNEFLTFVDRPLRKLAEKINQMAGEKLINTKAPVEERKVQIISALRKLGIAVENVINQDVKAVEETAQAVETTKPKVPRLPRSPKPATPTAPTAPVAPSATGGIPMPTGIVFPAIPLPQNIIPVTAPSAPTAPPAQLSPGSGFSQSVIAAVVQNAINSLPKYPNIAQVKQDFINFGRFLSNATTTVKNFAVNTASVVGPKFSSVFDTAKISVLNFAKKLNTPFGGNKIEKGIVSGFINPIRSAGSRMSSSIKKYMNYQLFYKDNKQPSFGGATIAEMLKAALKRGGTALATAGYSEMFRGGRGIVRAAKETPQYMYAKEKIKEKVPQYIEAFKKYGKDVAAQFKPSIDAFKSETIPAFKNGFANVRKYLREPFEASIQAFKTETIPAYLKGFQKIKSALDQIGSFIKNSPTGQVFINEAIPAYKKAISTAGSALKNAVLNAGAFSAAVGKAGFDIAKKTFTLNNLKKAASIAVNTSKTAIRIAYNIEKEIIKLPVTSTMIMVKGLQKAGVIVGSIWAQFKTSNFAQNTAIGVRLVKTAAAIDSGVKAISRAAVDAAAMAARAGVASATFAKNIATLNWDKAVNQVVSGLGKLANGIIGATRSIVISTGKAVVDVGKATLKLADKIVGLGRKAVVATASIAARPVTGLTSALFGIGRGPQYQKDAQGQVFINQFGGQTQKMGLFRKDKQFDQSGQLASRGPGVIGKTMKGVSGAFKGAIGMGGQMASMLTYQLGPAGMLLAGPMNKVIGLMQRFSKVSAPILIIITAIALAIMVLKKTFENMGGKAQNIMDNFKAAFENIKAIFGVLVGVFKDFFASLFGNGAKDSEQGAENIRQVIGSISEKVLAFTEKLKAFFEKTLEPVIRKVLSGVSLAIKGIIGFIGPIIQFIKNLVGYFKGGGEESKKEMGKAFDGMKEAAGKVFTGLITIFKTPFIFLIDIVFKVLGLITNIFERMADGIIIVIQYLIKGIINGFFAIPRGVVAIVQEVVRIWTNLQKALVDIAKESVKLIIKALFTLTGGAITLVGKLVGIFGGLINGWGKILQKMAEMFVEFGRKILVEIPKAIPGFGKVFDVLGLDSLTGKMIDLLSKPADVVGNIFENVGSTITDITESATNKLNDGLDAAENKALGVTDGVGNGIKAVLSSVRDIFELGDDVLKVAQDAALSGVDNVANNVRDAIGSSSDWVVGIGKGIKDWINGLKTAENIGKGIGNDVGGKDQKADAQTPSQAAASGITIAEAIDEGTKALKRGFFDKVIDSLSNAINKFKDKFREGLEKQKQDVLKFFDDQIAAIDALAEAEERLTATKEFEENRRLKIAERALQRDSYVKQRALAIYEGRIDDARLLSLQEEKDNRDFNKDLEKMDEDRNKTLQSQNREQAKKVIQQQKEQLSEKFDKDIKNFEDFVESIGKNGTLTKDQLTEQFKALQTEALKTSGDMKEAFQTYYTALPGLIQQNTDPTVGAFNMSLDTLIQAATTKYGTDVNSKDPASLLGITGLMLSGTSQAYTDGFNNSIIPAYSAGISEITKIGTDFNDPKNPNSPQNIYAKAISDANEAMVAEFYKMKTDATSAFAQVVDGLNAEAKRLAVEEAIRSATEQIDEEEKKRKRREGAEKALSGGTGDKSSPMGISRKMFLTEAGKDKVFKLGDTDEIIAAAKAKLIEYQMLPADTELSQKFDQPMKKALLAFQKKYLAKEMKNPQGNLGAGTAKALGLLGSAGVQKKYYGGSIKKSMAVGGIVPGFAQQGVPAILHGGEYVINSKAVSGLGQMFLNYINEFKFGIPRYTAPKIGMPQIGNQFKTEVIKTENETIHNYNFYVDNFIGEDQWFESMMKNYNVKVLPNRQKAAGLENRVVRTYNGINRGM